jgi:rSAM/selenodomain-associated transferase 1
VSHRVLVVAKAPVPGRVKTRLVPPLSEQQAAALGEALLADTLAGCRAEGCEVGILHAERSEAPLLRAVAEVPLVLQEGRGLGDALRLGMRRLLVDGRPGALVSSDVPGVPDGSLRRAFSLLEEGVCDVVLGPALDGGYWLIAMREHSDAPFEAIPWSTPAVLAATIERCEDAGLTVATVEPHRDVDTAVDLAFLREEVDPRTAPCTAALLRELDLDGAVPPPPSLRLEESRLLLASPWRTLVEDRLLRDDGRSTGYAYLAVPRAVFVVAVTDEGEVVLVRQYRHPVRDWTLEVPAGSVEDGETPLDAAERELQEEVGGRAGSWRHLTTFYSSSAHLSLRSDVFLATGVALAAPAPVEDEDVAVVRLPAAEAIRRARAGGLAEGQTALALLLAAPHLSS